MTTTDYPQTKHVTTQRSRWRKRIKHRNVVTCPGIDAYMTDQRGQAFIGDCLHAVSTGEWGLVSPSEAVSNEQALRSGGLIVATFVVPDDLDEEQVLLVDVINAGTRASRTSLRLLDPTVGVAVGTLPNPHPSLPTVVSSVPNST